MPSLFSGHSAKYKHSPQGFHAGELTMAECERYGVTFRPEQAAIGLLAVYRIFKVPKRGDSQDAN